LQLTRVQLNTNGSLVALAGLEFINILDEILSVQQEKSGMQKTIVHVELQSRNNNGCLHQIYKHMHAF